MKVQVSREVIPELQWNKKKKKKKKERERESERERVWMHWKGYEESLDLAYITPLSRWHGLGHRKVFPGPWLISKVKETAFE